MELRGHHLLCLPMYQGHGYSEEFCCHMTEVIKRIRETDEPVRVMISPDEVCSHCPNLLSVEQSTGEQVNTRSLREELRGRSCEHEARTAGKDRGLLKEFGLVPGNTYSRESLNRAVLSGMNEAVFERYCGKCQWRQEGLCSYSLWKEKYSLLFGGCRRIQT